MPSFLTVSRPEVTWSDLSAPEATTSALRRVAAEARRRTRRRGKDGESDRPDAGRGIAVLFSGPSGTGKTLAAEVLANHLDREMHRIDLAAVFGKYIDEAEKNLREVFEGASGAEVVLFFDEVDALFGKRTSVEDSHDRFANTETNYLLQRIERYDGLVILATNTVGRLDHPAIMRRFARVIDFSSSGRRA